MLSPCRGQIEHGIVDGRASGGQRERPYSTLELPLTRCSNTSQVGFMIRE